MANFTLSVMGAFAEFERTLIRERQREGVALAQQRGLYKGREKSLTPERAAELVQRADSGIPKVVLAHDYGIGREAVYQYIRLANGVIQNRPSSYKARSAATPNKKIQHWPRNIIGNSTHRAELQRHGW